MFRCPAAFLVACTALAACGGHDKAGGTLATRTQTIEVAMRDGSPRLLTAYAAAVTRIARAPTRVKPRTHWRSQEPNPEARTIADVRSGRLEFALVSARALDTVGVDAFAPMLAPLAVDSLETQLRVLESGLADRALLAIGRLGVVGVAALPEICGIRSGSPGRCCARRTSPARSSAFVPRPWPSGRSSSWVRRWPTPSAMTSAATTASRPTS